MFKIISILSLFTCITGCGVKEEAAEVSSATGAEREVSQNDSNYELVGLGDVISTTHITGQTIKFEIKSDLTIPENPTPGASTTEISFLFRLGGCLDRLAPLSYQTTNLADGRILLHVSALNLHTRASAESVCLAPPTRVVKITIPGAYAKDQVVITFAHSYSEKLKEGDLSMNPVTSMQVVEVKPEEPHCPVADKCELATQITLRIPLAGCMDRLANFSSTMQVAADGALEVFVAAQNIHTAGSSYTRCFVAPSTYKTVALLGAWTQSQVRVIPVAGFGL